ncbi:branched-chain amino acid aminotransferase [Monoraphidium neglectum]|uniref:Branched-chain amino acid aminotransferase n=1 Tax=Monoraphidium neglectum TaxID=145388 RepID=A0A0D2JID9_9CHLO|nr:branched-chain amino acid aminotransferase [Monoraphidium neglectum]KIY99102.1 branched-chain amino acid aminotransferase [Monoraphidium neglectum]|eukprot:XP_013898122.1 branched-chain amino acid aminotransferase [Monoraphidium neglectum]
MFISEWHDGAWGKGELKPYGPLPMMPSAQVLNYGQAAFEGMKAQRSAKDRIVLFSAARVV